MGLQFGELQRLSQLLQVLDMKKMIFILMIVLLATNSFALSLDTEPEECQTVDFYKPSTWISCGLAKTYKNAIEFLLTPLEQITEAFGNLMLINIDINTLAPYWSKINYIASAFLVIVIIYAGYLWLFAAIDTEKRRIAKQQTLDLIYVVIFINLSLIFGWLVLTLTNSLISYVWSAFLNQKISELTITEMILNGASTLILMFLYVLVLIIIGIPFFIKIITRHLLVMILIVLLPIIILLYYFTPTKQFGKKMMEILVINSFFPFIWMLVFAMGKVVVDVLKALYLPIDLGLLSFLAFTSTLYVNNKLYKEIGLNFDVASPVTYTYQSVREIYKQVPRGMKPDFSRIGSRIRDKWNSSRDVRYDNVQDTIGNVVDRR